LAFFPWYFDVSGVIWIFGDLFTKIFNLWHHYGSACSNTCNWGITAEQPSKARPTWSGLLPGILGRNRKSKLASAQAQLGPVEKGQNLAQEVPFEEVLLTTRPPCQACGANNWVCVEALPTKVFKATMGQLTARPPTTGAITRNNPLIPAWPQLENPIAGPWHAPKSPTCTHYSKGTQKKQLMHGLLSDPSYFWPHISPAPAWKKLFNSHRFYWLLFLTPRLSRLKYGTGCSTQSSRNQALGRLGRGKGVRGLAAEALLKESGKWRNNIINLAANKTP